MFITLEFFNYLRDSSVFLMILNLIDTLYDTFSAVYTYDPITYEFTGGYISCLPVGEAPCGHPVTQSPVNF